jgi:ribosomal protein L37E
VLWRKSTPFFGKRIYLSKHLTMAENCKNCAYEITLNFCPSCGQKKAKRIDGKYVKDEIQYTVLHTNKGFFYTCKQLLIRPGHATREFVEGNRVNHYKPLALVFLLAGISAFLSHWVIDFQTVYAGTMEAKQAAQATKVAESTMKYYSFILVSLIPLFSFITWLVFRKWGYNYFEHIVVNAFFTATLTLVSIAAMPLTYLATKGYLSMNTMMIIQMVWTPLLLFAFFKQFYKDRSGLAIAGRLLIFALFAFLIFVLLVFAVALIGLMMGFLKPAAH